MFEVFEIFIQNEIIIIGGCTLHSSPWLNYWDLFGNPPVVTI
jgi:hypothetical protein